MSNKALVFGLVSMLLWVPITITFITIFFNDKAVPWGGIGPALVFSIFYWWAMIAGCAWIDERENNA